jgi:hypothetical protein
LLVSSLASKVKTQCLPLHCQGSDRRHLCLEARVSAATPRHGEKLSVIDSILAGQQGAIIIVVMAGQPPKKIDK